jgi:nicotinamidase-related amidase
MNLMSGQEKQVREMTGERLFNLGSTKNALLIIDMQKAFLDEGAPFEVADGREIIGNIDKILSHCRRTGIPVIWTQSDHSAPYGGLILTKYSVVRNDKVLWKDHPSFQLYARMPQPLQSELRVVKHKYDAFYQTDLEMILRNLGVDTVMITGIDTCVCCESTARAAFFRDFNVAFVGDATASYSRENHNSTLRVIDDIFGRVMTTEKVLAELRGAGPQIAKTSAGLAQPRS